MRHLLAHKLGVYTPKDFATQLKAVFPGSEWVGETFEFDGKQYDRTAPLDMVCIGPGPGPKNVLATDGVVYPYRKFKALRGRKVRPSPASMPPAASSQPPPGATSSEGVRADQWGTARAIAVIGGAKFDEAVLETWLKSLPPDTVIVTGDGRGSEAAVKRISAVLGLRVDIPELNPVEPPEVFTRKTMLERLDSVIAYGKHSPNRRKDTQEPFYGPGAGKAQVESILALTSGRIALIGSGGRPSQVREWLKRMRSQREVVEI